MTTHTTGRRRAGSVWGHNASGRKGSWKRYISRIARRRDRIACRVDAAERSRKRPR